MANNVQTDATQPAAYHDIGDAADAILQRWTDGEIPSEDDETLEATDEALVEETDEDLSETFDDEEDYEEVEDTDEDPDDYESDDEDEPEAEEEEAQAELELSEDTLVEIQVDGQTKQASIKDLKRLYGQEASLTRKSQKLPPSVKKQKML